MNRPRFIGAAVVALAFFVLYCRTLAPDVLGHDSGDWQAAGATLGISHSPGSPAYTIIAWIFTQIVPFGTMAARVNLVSAVVGAIGVGAVFILVMMLFGRWLPAIVAAVTLGMGGQWWAHASVATPYNSVPTIIAFLLIMLLLWHRHGNVRLVWGGALLFGFGLAYHPTLLYFTPMLIAGVFVLGPWRQAIKLKSIALTFAALLLGLSIYAYLPIRSAMNPPVRYSEISSLSQLYKFVTVSEARNSGTFATSLPGQEELSDRLTEAVRQSYYPSFAFLVFGPAVTLMYPAVLKRLRPNRRFLIYLLVGAFAHMTIIFIISGIYVQYYLPVLLYFSIWAGLSMFLVMNAAEIYLGGTRYKTVPLIAVCFIYASTLLLGLPTIWPYANHHSDTGMRDFSDWVFSQAKEGAVVLANWDSYPGLNYVQVVDGMRQDLAIRPSTPENWRTDVYYARLQFPISDIYLARSLPFIDRMGAHEVGPQYAISIKGRTHQDLNHGKPDPASVELFFAET